MAEEQVPEVTPPTEAEIQEYRAFKEQVGVTPKQAAALIDDYIKLKDAAELPPVKAAEPAEQPPAPARKPGDEKIREDLFGLVPELKNLSTVEKKIEDLTAQMNDAQKEKFVETNHRADDLITAWLGKELNVDLDTPEGQEYAKVVSLRVANAIYGNQTRLDKLATGKPQVATEVLTDMQKAGQFKFDKVPVKPPPRATTLPFFARGNNPPTDGKGTQAKELEGLTHSERLQRLSERVYDSVMVREQ